MQKGDSLQSLQKPAITRDQLIAYGKAALDPNPIHLDDEVAKKMGLPGVIAHGMLTMAFMGEFLHLNLEKLGGGRIEEMSCRFKAMTFPGDVITVTGSVRDASSEKIHCDFEAKKHSGETTATGQAVLHLSK